MVPSYQRPATLRRCLDALLDQLLAPLEIVIVARIDDEPTQATVAEIQRHSALVRLATVDRPGVVRALANGLRETSGDLIAFTDDDARPHRDWLARLHATFCGDSAIAGVGGRDLHVRAGSESVVEKQKVGRLAWYGRVTGNHHSGVGPARDVHVLKGVNCAYRRSVLEQVGYDNRLRGDNQHYHELALGLAIVRLGGRLVYDPAIRVDHEEAPRVNATRMGTRGVQDAAFADAVFNEALTLTEHLNGARGLTYRLWSALVGHRDSPGLAQAVRFTPAVGRRSWRRWRIAKRARVEARRVAGARS
ncbi:MAG: hypothetical protein AVDCRST_MAG67-535 [uncultured Solirubrobacteraceae bacterium]|uniref:Glycosyltransferase 2-like domain-containing protein n=1 Tax=uncultured Solirubrobacteraceae bacterium TaxID=1162706 RepID=A0A6J4RSK3_9ACTN|nr:MAG: hypothetical protein AVDCRST_MAG67-535 [uncultured Solirubrobacteraceae bacterium]